VSDMTPEQALHVVRNFKAYPKETVHEAAMLILDNESAYLPEDIAEACAAEESTLDVDPLVSEEEIRAMATRVIRGLLVPDDTTEAVMAMLIDDLVNDIEIAIVNWATKPHPLARQ
jgi:hypothetical protein